VNAFNALATLLAHDLVPHPDFSSGLTKTTRRIRKQVGDVTKTRMALALLAREKFRMRSCDALRRDRISAACGVAHGVRRAVHMLQKFFWKNASREARATRNRVRARANRQK
jgi:hypothetical protein